jgi:hypothetical protein
MARCHAPHSTQNGSGHLHLAPVKPVIAQRMRNRQPGSKIPRLTLNEPLTAPHVGPITAGREPKRVYLMAPANWRSARLASRTKALNWSAAVSPPARCTPEGGKPPHLPAPSLRIRSQTALRAFAASRVESLRAWTLAALSLSPANFAKIATGPRVLATRWLTWNQTGRRRMLAAISVCVVLGVAAIPVAMGVAYSQWQPEKPSITRARIAWQGSSSRSTIAPVALPAPTSHLTTPASSASPREPLADEPQRTNPQAALLSDVSTMDLTMPIAEPDLDIASRQSLWAQVGKESGVDPLLLYSVALVESRSLLPGGKVGPTPWLFRVNDHLVLGERHHVQLEMATASQLGSAVQDVGIMQVYYPMHRDAVRDPLTLLDPRTNISVAAKILHDGMHETRDPVLGVGYYHSHTPQLARDYGTAVLTVYQRLKSLYHPGKARQAVAR